MAVYRVALNFFCVVYGFLFGMQLIFIMVAQNREVQLLDGSKKARFSVPASKPRPKGAPLDGSDTNARAAEPDYH